MIIVTPTVVFTSNSFKGTVTETILTTTTTFNTTRPTTSPNFSTTTPSWQNFTITRSTTIPASTIQTTIQSPATNTIPTVTAVLSPSSTSVPDNTLYTEEPPVKLLDIESLAKRFPASDSQYRVSLENGYVRNIYCLFLIIYNFTYVGRSFL